MAQASAISRMMAFITNFSALIGFVLLKDINIPLGVSLALSGAVGSYIGAHFAVKWGPKLIQPMLTCTLLIMCCFTMYKAWM